MGQDVRRVEHQSPPLERCVYQNGAQSKLLESLAESIGDQIGELVVVSLKIWR